MISHSHALEVYRAMTLPELYKEASHLLRKISNNPTHHDTRTLYELCHSAALEKELAPLKRKTIFINNNANGSLPVHLTISKNEGEPLHKKGESTNRIKQCFLIYSLALKRKTITLCHN